MQKQEETQNIVEVKKNIKGNKKNIKHQPLNIDMIKKIFQLSRQILKDQSQEKYKIIKNLIQAHIKPLVFHQIPDLQKCIIQDLLQIQHKGLNSNQQRIKQYLILSKLFRQQQISTLVTDAFYKNYISSLTKTSALKNQLIELWKEIPYKNLQKLLKQFELEEEFKKIEPQIMQKHLIMLISDNKTQQCYEYYKLYNSKQLKNFQQQHLIPKIIKSDQIFTPSAFSLLKQNEQIKKSIISQIDPQIGLRVLESIGEDARNYQNVLRYMLRQHYKSILHQHGNKWYVVEDKLNFSKQFIQWYCEQSFKNQPQIIVNGKLTKTKYIKQSILYRSGLISKENVEELIENPLQKYDHFGNVETIFYKINHPQLQINQIQNEFFYLQKIGINEQSVKFVDRIDSQAFKQLLNQINRQQQIIVGYDSQFRCIQTKYDIQGVSIIQLYFDKKGYILDFVKLENQPQFINFMVNFLTNKKIIKVGHTISSDLSQLSRTFKLPNNQKFDGFVDIVKLFKQKYQGLVKSSLSYIFQGFNKGLSLSKYEQRSNWMRRPLKKTQVHYAISDAYTCVHIYNKIKSNSQFHDWGEGNVDNLQKHQVIRDKNLVYSTKYKQLLSQRKPIFLVDNMLKRLAGTMRNMGIDTQYISNKDYKLALQIAEKDKRIIITRDTKFFQRRDQSVPIYLLDQIQDLDDMFNNIVKKFKINLKKFTPLSRCNKCNHHTLEDISIEEALQSLNFTYQQTNIRQFWRCQKCRQIYWQGNQFKKAQKQYNQLKKKN